MNPKFLFYLKSISIFCAILGMLFFFTNTVFAQSVSDSTAIESQSIEITKKTPNKSYSLLKKSIIPTVLIIGGSGLSGSHFEHTMKTKIRNQVGNNYEFRIDDYMVYAPIVELYLADILGVKSKNHWFDQTKYLLFSNLLSGGVTHGLKQLIDKERPNGGHFSFPSGHTELVFTNATVLKNEFKDSSPLLAYSGYGFAIATGTFRMINNKHWFSDVLVGAGIGILATEIVYHFEPLKNFNPFKKSKNVSILPQINSNNYGVYCSYKF
jgi:hypothetical protein